ncbi:MAG: XrtA/PEP-CTERM system TPR-repeat protein PrsT [Sedimenticola sp.]
MNILIKGLILGGLVLTLNACSSDITDSEHLEQAQSFLEQGKTRAAMIEAKNSVSKNPENIQSRFLLGKLHLRLGNPEAAEKELRRVLELGVSKEAVLPILAEALLYQFKHDEVLELNHDILRDSARVDVLVIQAYALIGQGKVEKAKVYIEKAKALDQASENVRVADARLSAIYKDIKSARLQLQAILEENPANALGWSLLGDIELREQNLGEAEEAFNNAIKNTAYNYRDMIKRIHIWIRLKKFSEAKQDIELLKKRLPDNATIDYALGMYHFNKNEFSEAADAFTQAITKRRNYIQPIYYLAVSHFRLNNFAQAEQYGNAFLAAYPGSVSGRKLVAILSLLNKKYAQAEDLLRPVVAAFDKDVAAMNLMANALLKQGETDEAIELLTRVADLEPGSSTAQLRLAAGLLAGGDQAGGIEHLETVLETDPGFEQADILLVMNYLKRKELDKALTASRTYQARNPDNVMPFNLQGIIFLEMKNDKRAMIAFQKARQLSPGDPTASQNLAALSLKKEKFDEAREYYLEVLEHHQNHLATLIKLAALDGLEEKEGLMVEHLQQAVKAHPDVIDPRLILARHYLVSNKAQLVPGLLNELPEEQRRNPAVMTVLATSQLSRKEYAASKDTLEKLVLVKPESGQVHHLLFKAYSGLGDDVRASEALLKAVQLAPTHIPTLLDYANALLSQGNVAEAEVYINTLRDLSPKNPYVLRLEALLADINGSKALALEKAEKSYEALPDRTTMLFLASRKWDFGDIDGAIQLQEQWGRDHPEDVIAQLQLASAYSNLKRDEAAIEVYRAVLNNDANNLTALNNLAWKLRDSNPGEALEYAEKANSIEPESGPILDTLALLLLKNGEIEKASRTIKRALEKTPDSPTLQYHSALIDVQAGREATARNTLQKLVGNAVVFPEKEDAKKLLGELSPKG